MRVSFKWVQVVFAEVRQVEMNSVDWLSEPVWVEKQSLA